MLLLDLERSRAAAPKEASVLKMWVSLMGAAPKRTAVPGGERWSPQEDTLLA